MIKTKLFLKTIFCCMACDSAIVQEEIDLIKQLSAENKMFNEIDLEKTLNQWISEINKGGANFLKEYLHELSESKLTKEEEQQIVDLAIKTIEADNCIEYSEVKFFKKIRSRLSLSDDEILKRYPNKDDFLLPDNNVAEDPVWNDVTFADISFTALPN